jgi:ureidoglycolate lyase
MVVVRGGKIRLRCKFIETLSMLTLHTEPITAAAFRPFGTLLVAPNVGVRENFAAEVFNGRPESKANLALIRETPADASLTVTTLERHPFSTQAFFPLSVPRYLVVVCGAASDGAPDLKTLRAFDVPGDQAISYAASTWHMGIKTLDAPGVFAMLIHEDGSAADCEFREVEPFLVNRIK